MKFWFLVALIFFKAFSLNAGTSERITLLRADGFKVWASPNTFSEYVELKKELLLEIKILSKKFSDSSDLRLLSPIMNFVLMLEISLEHVASVEEIDFLLALKLLREELLAILYDRDFAHALAVFSNDKTAAPELEPIINYMMSDHSALDREDTIKYRLLQSLELEDPSAPIKTHQQSRLVIESKKWLDLLSQKSKKTGFQTPLDYFLSFFPKELRNKDKIYQMLKLLATRSTEVILSKKESIQALLPITGRAAIDGVMNWLQIELGLSIQKTDSLKDQIDFFVVHKKKPIGFIRIKSKTRADELHNSSADLFLTPSQSNHYPILGWVDVILSDFELDDAITSTNLLTLLHELGHAFRRLLPSSIEGSMELDEIESRELSALLLEMLYSQPKLLKELFGAQAPQVKEVLTYTIWYSLIFESFNALFDYHLMSNPQGGLSTATTKARQEFPIEFRKYNKDLLSPDPSFLSNLVRNYAGVNWLYPFSRIFIASLFENAIDQPKLLRALYQELVFSEGPIDPISLHLNFTGRSIDLCSDSLKLFRLLERPQ